MSRSKSSVSSSSSSRHPTWHLPFSQRASVSDTPPLTSYLFRLMAAKRSNLCLSADVQTTAELLDVAEECGDSICVFKTHSDIISDFSERSVKGLVEIAVRKKFLIFEDRKFGDIGNTVQAQYVAGPHRIASWASIVNAHIFPGPAIVTALKSAASSAIAAYNTSTSIEISGGFMTPAASYFHAKPPSSKTRQAFSDTSRRRQEQDSDDHDESDEDESDQEDNPTSARSIDIPERPATLDGRKPSVVSINTTISSSTEYVTSPTDPLSADAVLNERPPLARGLLLLAQMSSEDNLFTPQYTAKCVELGRQHRDFVLGFIAQGSLNKDPSDNFMVMTPGVSMPPPAITSGGTQTAAPCTSSSKSRSSQSSSTKKAQPSRTTPTNPGAASAGAGPNSRRDGLGQQYNTPRHLILEKGVDVIIVGRAILNAEDRGEEAERYRKEGWNAIRERCGKGE